MINKFTSFSLFSPPSISPNTISVLFNPTLLTHLIKKPLLTTSKGSKVSLTSSLSSTSFNKFTMTQFGSITNSPFSTTTTTTTWPTLEQKEGSTNYIALRSNRDVANYYQLEKELGFGTFGTVYKARDLSTGKIVALKYMKKKAQPFYNREIDMMKRVTGFDNCIKLVNVMESKDSIYVVSEYLKGGDLFDYISEHNVYSQTLSVLQALELTKSMLRALENCHLQNFAHLDVKPENYVFKEKPSAYFPTEIDILNAPKRPHPNVRHQSVTSLLENNDLEQDFVSDSSIECMDTFNSPRCSDGKLLSDNSENKLLSGMKLGEVIKSPELVLIDFGAAQPFRLKPFARESRLYEPGMDESWVGEKEPTIGGTASYVSPEVVLQSKFSSRSDVWSVGISLYMMLTGQRPFDFDAEKDKHLKHQHSKPGELLPDEVIQRKIKNDATGDRSQSIFYTCPDLEEIGISDDIKKILRQLTNPDPAKRPSSTEAIAIMDELIAREKQLMGIKIAPSEVRMDDADNTVKKKDESKPQNTVTFSDEVTVRS